MMRTGTELNRFTYRLRGGPDDLFSRDDGVREIESRCDDADHHGKLRKLWKGFTRQRSSTA